MPASSLQRRVLNILWKYREYFSKFEYFLCQYAPLERRNRHSNAGAFEREKNALLRRWWNTACAYSTLRLIKFSRSNAPALECLMRRSSGAYRRRKHSDFFLVPKLSFSCSQALLGNTFLDALHPNRCRPQRGHDCIPNWYLGTRGNLCIILRLRLTYWQ